MKYYTEEHEWCMQGGGNVWRVGITNFAQDQLGDVVAIELPAVGTIIKSNDACGVVESVKSASDINAPIPGKVIAINKELHSNPGLLNESAEKDGWLLEVKTDSQPDISAFMDAQTYNDKFSVEE